MKSHISLKTVTLSLLIMLLFPFIGKINPAATSLNQTRFLSPASNVARSIYPATSDPLPYNAYLPLVLNKKINPLQTVFGAEMAQLTEAGGLEQMVEAGVTWTRRNGVVWSAVEPTEGARNWGALAGLESELREASSKGLQVILVVRSTPEWARKTAGSGAYCGPVAADKLAALGSFMHDLVVRYSQPPYEVKYWELWNEPDIDPALVPTDSVYGCWGDDGDAYYGGGYYAEMLKVVYPQVKAVDPQAQVLVGGLLLDCDPRGTPSVCASLTPPHADKPPKFLEGILRGGGGPYFDGVSFHAYDVYWGASGQYGIVNWNSAWNTTGPTLIAKASFVRSVLSEYGYPDKFLMNTETALLCNTCSNDATYEAAKADYIGQVYAAGVAQGLRANIWFSVLGWQNSGLLKADLSPQPAYTALQFSRSELGEASWVRDVTEYAGVKGYEYRRGDRRIWVVWSLDGNAHSVNLPGVPLAVWDVLGNSILPAASLNISLTPLYLEWNP
jgi:hypothetical protein